MAEGCGVGLGLFEALGVGEALGDVVGDPLTVGDGEAVRFSAIVELELFAAPGPGVDANLYSRNPPSADPPQRSRIKGTSQI